ncbi:MAG: 2Fe-2S iron-sulfur cluster binding domain-containing protein [Myxococcales bacterium]|nr:2Fe-2S iron-sulfur cluster binding domain-containing protein [Myxococcales bacterium]
MSAGEGREVTVTFRPDGATARVAAGRRLLGVVLGAGRPIGHSCRGLGVCLACGLWVEGPMSPIEPDEARLIARRAGPTSAGAAAWRIACLARVMGDVTVWTDYW